MADAIGAMCLDIRVGPCPTVLLRHELPDGSWHVDWMIARDAAADSPLITFRLPEPLDAVEPGRTLMAERIGEHRAAYLRYEGAVSGNRGHVTRLRFGTVVDVFASDNSPKIDLAIHWEHPKAGVTAQRVRLIAENSPNYLAKVL